MRLTRQEQLRRLVPGALAVHVASLMNRSTAGAARPGFLSTPPPDLRVTIDAVTLHTSLGPEAACKAITVVARFGASDADGTVGGYSVELRSDWMQKEDTEAQHRQQAEAEKNRLDKEHEQKMNSARRNQPTL
jgi:hypothetical protein